MTGITLILRTTRQAPVMIGRDVTAMIVIGWGLINVFDGVLYHLIFTLHNLREADHQMMSNVVFLIVAVGVLGVGIAMLRKAKGVTDGSLRSEGCGR